MYHILSELIQRIVYVYRVIAFIAFPFVTYRSLKQAERISKYDD